MSTTVDLDFTITCVRRDENGQWSGHVTINGETYEATRRGGWRIHDPQGGVRHALLPVAERLQQHVRRIERRERQEEQEVAS